MYVRLVQDAADALFDPEAPAWSNIAAEVLALEGTPAEAQPTRHIRNSLAGRARGGGRTVQLRAAHDGKRVYFRLEWTDPTADLRHEEDRFPDAAAVLFPINGEAVLETMGSAQHPVNAWFWRPDIEACPENLVAHGIGTVERGDADGLETRSVRDGATWKVVLARPLSNGQPGSGVVLEPGRKTSIAVAVWDGSAGERAGIKAFSQRWRDIEIES